MADTGKMIALIKAFDKSADPTVIENAVSDWLDDHITNPDSPPLDRSLTQSNAATPADITGQLKSALYATDDNIYSIFDNGDTLFNPTAFTAGGVRLDDGSVWFKTPPCAPIIDKHTLMVKLFSNKVKVTIVNGYKIRGAIYNSDGSFSEYFNWISDASSYPASLQNKKGKYVRVYAMKTDESNLTQADYDALTSVYSIKCEGVADKYALKDDVYDLENELNDLSANSICIRKNAVKYDSDRSGWKNGAESRKPSSYGTDYISVEGVGRIDYAIVIRDGIDIWTLFDNGKNVIATLPATQWAVEKSGSIELSNYPTAKYVAFSAYSATGVAGISSDIEFISSLYLEYENVKAGTIKANDKLKDVPYYNSNLPHEYIYNYGWKNGVISEIPSSAGTDYIDISDVDYVDYAIKCRDKIDVWELFDENKTLIAYKQGSGWNTLLKGTIDLNSYNGAKYITFSAYASGNPIVIDSTISVYTAMYNRMNNGLITVESLDETVGELANIHSVDFDEIIGTSDGVKTLYYLPTRPISNTTPLIYVNGIKKFYSEDYTADAKNRLIILNNPATNGSKIGCHIHTDVKTENVSLALDDCGFADGKTITGEAAKYLATYFDDFGKDTVQWFEMADDPTNSERKVISAVAKSATEHVRCQCRFEKMAADIMDSTISIYLPASSFECLNDYPNNINWFTVQEWWLPFGHLEPTYVTVTEGYRMTLGICKKAEDNHLYFYLRCEDKLMNENPSDPNYGKAYFVLADEIDDRTTKTFEIPYDKWITLHSYVKCGSEDYGHFTLETTVDGVKTTIFNQTIQAQPTDVENYPNSEPSVIGRATCLIKMYTDTSILDYVVANSEAGEMRMYWKNLTFIDKTVVG